MSFIVKDPTGTEFEVQEPQRGDFPPTLGGAISYYLTLTVFKVGELLGGWVGRATRRTAADFMDDIEPELIEIIRPIVSYIREVEGVPPEFVESIDRAMEGGSFVSLAAVLGFLLPVLDEILQIALSPALIRLSYEIDQVVHSARPSPDQAWPMVWRGAIDDTTLNEWLAEAGWDSRGIQAFAEIIRPRLPAEDLVQWAFRIDQDPNVINEELRRRGYTDADIEKLQQIVPNLPGPGDLVRFALREAWRDDVAAKFGYDADMPPEFTQWMQRLGFDPVWARNYWRAHWDLPSIQQGFEMLHRDVIDQETLETLLRVADIPSFWRDALLQISYRPYTRVDVRRMHRIGQLSDSELVRAYQDLGFDLEHAQGMAEFTIKYNRRSERDFSEAEIRKAYRLRALSRDEAVALLLDIGQSQEHAEFVISLEDYKQAQKIRDAQIDVIEDRYIEGELSDTDAITQLGKLGLRGEQMHVLLEEWRIKRKRKVARATKADIKRFYKKDIIDQNIAREELDKRRVPEELANWYIQQWDMEIAEDAAEELERQQREQQRIVEEQFATERRQAIQEINVAIAEQRTVIADARLALAQVHPPDEVRDMEQRIDELTVEIRSKQVEIREQQALITRTEELIRRVPEPELLEQLRLEIDQAQERIDAIDVAIEKLETRQAEIDIELMEAIEPEQVAALETEKTELARDIEELETEQAELRLFVRESRNTLRVTPEPEMLEGLRQQIAAAEETIADLRTDIARLRERQAEIRGELKRMPTPGQADELRTTILEARAEIQRLQLQKAQIPVSP